MPDLDDTIAAQMALLSMYAEDTYEALPPGSKGTLRPPIDMHVQPKWKVIGYITGRDGFLDQNQLFSINLGQLVFYGFLAQDSTDPMKFVTVIRGTENLKEWAIDAEFLPVPHAIKGHAESGFYSIYRSMMYQDLVGGDPVILAAGIAGAVGTQNTVMVIAHSLGSALGTYLTLDLVVTAKMGDRASACLFASPRPGDIDFVTYFDEQVKNYTVYNYSLDAVTTVPGLFRYTSLPKVTKLMPQAGSASITNTLPCNHHAVCYAAMLDANEVNSASVGPNDQGCASCIVGFNVPVISETGTGEVVQC